MIEIGNCSLIIKKCDGQFDSAYDIKKFFENDNKNILILTNFNKREIDPIFSHYPHEYTGVKEVNRNNYRKIIKDNIYNIDIILFFFNSNILFLEEAKNQIDSIGYKSIFVIKDSTYLDFKHKIEYLKFSYIYEIYTNYDVDNKIYPNSFSGGLSNFKDSKVNIIKDVINNWESSTEDLIKMKIRDIKINNIIDKQ